VTLTVLGGNHSSGSLEAALWRCYSGAADSSKFASDRRHHRSRLPR